MIGSWPRMGPSRDCAYHPFFRGILFAGLWHFYNERLTPAGRGLLWATFITSHFTLCSLEIQAFIPFSYLWGAWLVACLAARSHRPAVQGRIRHAAVVGAGEELPVRAELRATARMGGLPVRLVPHRLPPEIECVPPEGVRLEALASGAEPLDAAEPAPRLALRCRRRGIYRLQGFRVETPFPLGLIHARRLLSDERSLIVHPRIYPVTRLNLPTGRRFHPGGVTQAGSVGDAVEYLGNREYRPGDSIRDIDWRATARLGRPIVREYLEEYFFRVAILLDTYLPPGAGAADREAFEAAISVAASLLSELFQSESLLDLFAAGGDVYEIHAGRGGGSRDRALEILACLEPVPQPPFERLRAALGDGLGRITVVLCVFLDWEPQRRDLVAGIRSQGVDVRVLIVRDGACTTDPAADPLADRIRVISPGSLSAGISV